jgi:DNA-binding protein HU-alpha
MWQQTGIENAMATKKTAPKAGAAKTSKPEAKPKAAPSNVMPIVVAQAEAAEASVVASTLRVRDLVDRVAETSGAKKKDVREIVEATLAALGTAIDAGEVLNLPPLGKLRVSRAASGETGAATLKLRRSSGANPREKADKEGLAEVSEDS